MASILYGSGLCLNECLCLHVKDIDFQDQQITVHDGKGYKDRVTMLPQSASDALQRHLKTVKLLHQDDLSQGYGESYPSNHQMVPLLLLLVNVLQILL